MLAGESILHPVKNNYRFSKLELALVSVGLGLLALGAVLLFVLFQQYQDKFYPGVQLDNISIGGKTPAEVHQLLAQRQQMLQSRNIILSAEEVKIASNAAELGLQLNTDLAINQAFSVGHAEPVYKAVWRLVQPKIETSAFTTQITYNPEKLKSFIELLKKKIDVPGQDPSVSLGSSGIASSLKVNPGVIGKELNEDATLQTIQSLPLDTQTEVAANMELLNTVLTPEQTTQFKERASKYVGKQLALRVDKVIKNINDQEMIALLAYPDEFSATKITTLINGLNKIVDRPPQNAEFAYDPQTLKVTKFQPALNGWQLKPEETAATLVKVLSEIPQASESPKELKLAVTQTPPSVSLGQTNNLGIVERVGLGESRYLHSIPGRIHNVALTASRINNTLVAPGQEFSFVKTLGDVSAETGFQPAYVIKGGKTVLGDGGGVCQVSTTLFRAVLNGGLKVTKRLPHSYRVSYYELNSKPGVDATVYAGEVDFRFVNDTGHYLLIHTETDSTNLAMSVEIYGTSDGRTAEIVDHKVYDFRSAPPPLYQPDPSIPKGKIKQVDFAASGVKTSFKNVIKDKSGKLIREDTYFSNYQPWRAVYLVGE